MVIFTIKIHSRVNDRKRELRICGCLGQRYYFQLRVVKINNWNTGYWMDKGTQEPVNGIFLNVRLDKI